MMSSIYPENEDRKKGYQFKSVNIPDIPVHGIIMTPIKMVLYLCYGILGMFGLITIGMGVRKYSKTDKYKNTKDLDEHIKNVWNQRL